MEEVLKEEIELLKKEIENLKARLEKNDEDNKTNINFLVVDRAIREVDETMDYENIIKVMNMMNWCYYGHEGKMTVDVVKDLCHQLIKEAIENESDVSTGGFYVDYINRIDSGVRFGYSEVEADENCKYPTVNVKFVIEEGESSFN